jgi:hypothetical protein
MVLRRKALANVGVDVSPGRRLCNVPHQTSFCSSLSVNVDVLIIY